jgi:AmmeMemoRadiSam system protein B
MGEVRAPFVAGSFYPSEPDALEAKVQGYLAEARISRDSPLPKALIAPHAGYLYSGPVAGSAFASLIALRGRISRVVLMGPAHRARLPGIALPEARAFASPLGMLEVDSEGARGLLALPQVLHVGPCPCRRAQP